MVFVGDTKPASLSPVLQGFKIYGKSYRSKEFGACSMLERTI
jgi:hypothetical protein